MSGIEYEVGDRVWDELMGADGLDAQFGVNAASELLSRGLATYDKQKASEETAAKLDQAKAADVAWAEAEERLNLALQSKPPDAARVEAAQVLAQTMSQAAASTGMGLPPDATAKRCAAAQAAVAAAAKAAGKDPSKLARVKAWQKVAAACSSGTSLQPGAGAHHAPSSQPSFFTKVHAGLPTWGWMVGGAAILTGGVLLIRALRKR